MRLVSMLGMAAIALWPSLAQATTAADFTLKSTQDLYLVCTTPQSDPLYREAVNFCEGYLLGIVSYHDAIVTRENLQRLICYPQGVTRDEGIRAFTDWGAKHQGDQKFMSDPPVVGAVRGLASKWPCK